MHGSFLSPEQVIKHVLEFFPRGSAYELMFADWNGCDKESRNVGSTNCIHLSRLCLYRIDSLTQGARIMDDSLSLSQIYSVTMFIISASNCTPYITFDILDLY